MTVVQQRWTYIDPFIGHVLVVCAHVRRFCVASSDDLELRFGEICLIHLILLHRIFLHIILLAEKSAKKRDSGHSPKSRVSEEWRLNPLIRSWKSANADEVVEAEGANES